MGCNRDFEVDIHSHALSFVFQIQHTARFPHLETACKDLWNGVSHRCLQSRNNRLFSKRIHFFLIHREVLEMVFPDYLLFIKALKSSYPGGKRFFEMVEKQFPERYQLFYF